MQYVYYCPKCNNLECYDSIDNTSISCANCGNRLLPLKVSMDEWNNYSNDEMLNAVNIAKNSGLKKPVFKPTIEEDTDFDYEVYKKPIDKKKKNNNKALPFIIGAVAIIIIITLVAVLLKKGNNSNGCHFIDGHKWGENYQDGFKIEEKKGYEPSIRDTETFHIVDYEYLGDKGNLWFYYNESGLYKVKILYNDMNCDKDDLERFSQKLKSKFGDPQSEGYYDYKWMFEKSILKVKLGYDQITIEEMILQ